MEGHHDAPEVAPGGDARHRADRRHHVVHLREKERGKWPALQLVFVSSGKSIFDQSGMIVTGIHISHSQ